MNTINSPELLTPQHFGYNVTKIMHTKESSLKQEDSPQLMCNLIYKFSSYLQKHVLTDIMRKFFKAFDFFDLVTEIECIKIKLLSVLS